MTNQLRLLFLFVVISGALCTGEDYVIMSQCAHNKAIYIAAEGTVSVTDISQIQNITIVGRPDFVNNNFKIALLAKETQKYLCFNDHWKLVGMKELQDTCYFDEAIVHGYFVFRSVVDLQRRVGFTQRGRAVGPKKTVNDACYMFTKIPADQFFHQHTHFSAPKTKSTTKIPKTDYTNTPQSVLNHGRGSGGGRPKQNRPKNQHRQGETLTNNNSNNKKNKKQRNGNKQRQQQQQQQQQKQDMQQIRGHSYNLSNPKNSTYLNSSRQNLVLSQHSINNHAKEHNHHLPQNHQVRHHHNDPKKVARRQQHDQKQKTKLQLQRVTRPSPSATAAATAPSLAASALATSTLVHSLKPQYLETSTSYAEINPTSVVQQLTTIAAANRNTLTPTVDVVTKRKGRRRKGEKMHKKVMQKKDHMATKPHGRSPFTSSISPSSLASYEEEDFMTSSTTDNGWLNNDIVMASIKPTSASLPIWDTWYPSSSTAVTDEDSEYPLSSSVTAASITETETNDDLWFSSTRESASMTDIVGNTLSLQTSISLPSAAFSTTQIENDSDETITPTQFTNLGTMTTTTTTTRNTSIFNPGAWSTTTILSDDNNEEIEAMFATPKLNDGSGLAAIENYFDELNNTDSENSTATASANDEQAVDTSSLFPTEEFTEMADTTSDTALGKSSFSNNDQTSEMSNSMAATATTLYSDEFSTKLNGSKTTTDCKHATNNTANIANKNKNDRHRNNSDSVNTEMPKSETKLETLNKTAPTTIQTLATLTTSTRSEKTTTTLINEELGKSSLLTRLATLNRSLHINDNDNLTAATATVNINSTPTTHSSSLYSTHKSLVPSSSTPSTTPKTLRKSTQKLWATQFHQLTYIRNEADLDIDSLDNISMYPKLFENNNDATVVKPLTSRLTLITGYLPRPATSTLPESIRLARDKIMSRLRRDRNYA